MSIRVSNLDFSYPGRPVLQRVNFEVARGEFLGIIGPNGGGKTTLLSLLMGFLKPTRGQISLHDQPPQKRRLEIGYVPQNFHYDRQFPITVLEVVLTGRLGFHSWFGYRQEDKRMALETLDRVGLKQKAHLHFSELSGGQAQRVLIARALVSQPRFLFLDEAVSNIDPVAQEEIYQLLYDLKKEITILMVTHDLKSAINHVHRVLLIQGTASLLSKEELCEHFALGVYHPPLIKTSLNVRPS